MDDGDVLLLLLLLLLLLHLEACGWLAGEVEVEGREGKGALLVLRLRRVGDGLLLLLLLLLHLLACGGLAGSYQ